MFCILFNFQTRSSLVVGYGIPNCNRYSLIINCLSNYSHKFFDPNFDPNQNDFKRFETV